MSALPHTRTEGAPDPPVATCSGAAVFSDLVGFTEFTDAMGDAAALAVLDQQTALVAAALGSRPDGRVVKELGDGIMMWFRTADGAISTALDLMHTIDAARRAGDFPLAVRIGIHHGDAIARGADLVGQTINIAARVSDLAGPGELLVSEHTVDAAHGPLDGVELRSVGPVSVKGVSEPIWLQRIAWQATDDR